MKKVILVPALLGVMGIGGIIAVAGEGLIGSAADSKKLTVEQIEKKALEAVNGKITELEFEKEGTKSFYEVEVVTNGAEYDLKFDAFSGELLKKVKGPLEAEDRVDDVKDDISNKTKVDDTSTSTSNTPTNTVTQEDDTNHNQNAQQPTITQVTEKQNTLAPVQNTVISNRDDDDHHDDDRYEDDDRYDDDRYEDDGRYDDDRYEDDGRYDDDRYEDDDDNDDDN